MSDPSVIHDSQADEKPSTGSTSIAGDLLAARPWIAHYEQGVPAELVIPDQPLTWLLDQTVASYPKQTAFIYYGTKLTYARFSTLAYRFAAELQRLGVRKGDRVAVALPNIPQYAVAFYGALRAGAVVVPTNPLYTEREMRHQLADSGARVVVMLDMYYPIVRTVRAGTSLEHIIVTSPADFLPPLLHTLYPLSQRRTKLPEPRLNTKELASDPMLHSMKDLLKKHTGGGNETFNLPEPA
ncbi:MAG: AMP-binding protein, partial [Chloroflexota bacterium]|nr:AMP-binding protein [Chloroflexota bacterium]